MNQRPVQHMKIFAVVGILFALAAAVTEYYPSHAGVEWVPYETAFQRARAENKMVFVDIYAEWCAPCKTMDKTTFANDTLISALKNNLIATRVNIDDKKIGAEVKKKFNISAMPTSLLLRSEQIEVQRHVGYLNAREMMEWLSDTLVSEFLLWNEYAAAVAAAQSSNKSLFIMVLHDSLKVMEMQRSYRDKNIKQLIKQNFIPVLLINSVPQHQPVIKKFALLPSDDFIGCLFTFTPSMELIRTMPLRNFDALRLQPLVEQLTAR